LEVEERGAALLLTLARRRRRHRRTPCRLLAHCASTRRASELCAPRFFLLSVFFCARFLCGASACVLGVGRLFGALTFLLEESTPGACASRAVFVRGACVPIGCCTYKSKFGEQYGPTSCEALVLPSLYLCVSRDFQKMVLPPNFCFLLTLF
jgi:hypothetical protein